MVEIYKHFVFSNPYYYIYSSNEMKGELRRKLYLFRWTLCRVMFTNPGITLV